MSSTNAVIEIVAAPEVSCTAWGDTFGSTAEAAGSERELSNWIAADATHSAVLLDLPVPHTTTTSTAAAPQWTALVATAVKQSSATSERYEVDEVELGAAPAPTDAPFLYVVRMDVQPAAEDEFNDWYTNDHIAFLSQVTGVYSARRFIASNASDQLRKYVATYYLRCPSVRQTAEWQRAAHTDWSKAIRRHHIGKLATMFARAGGGHR